MSSDQLGFFGSSLPPGLPAVGATIGWHRDKAVFRDVIGISLLAPCTFRLRRQVGDHWERASLVVESLRYSITFRTLRRPRA